MAKLRTGRRRFTDTQRARILAAMERRGLTYAQAARKFGVSEVTIWKWKKIGRTAPRRLRSKRARSEGSLAGLVRQEVRAKMHESLAVIVRAAVAAQVRKLLGPERRRRARL